MEIKNNRFACMSGKRVSVRGEILYGKNGKIHKIINGRVEIIEDSHDSLEDIFDSDFTGGLPAREYLDKLHAGTYEKIS